MANRPAPARSIDPATGATIAEWPWMSAAEIETALGAAATAAAAWAREPVERRAERLVAAAKLLRERKSELARMITREMGKVLAEAEAEVEKSAGACEYVAQQAPAWLADEPVATNARRSYVAYLPLGVVLSILPWNFPVWQIFRCAASALMAGNVLLMKHSPNVQGCARAVAQLLQDAGLPPGAFQNLNIDVDAVPAIIADRRVAAVTLTGSPTAGGKVAALAGAACKKSVLELGGSDAFVVLADADIDAAVQAGLRARFTNCGQVCLAAKRFLVEAPVARRFAEAFAEGARRLVVGNPLQPGTQLGPMAREDLRAGLDAQVRASVAKGGRVLAGAAARPGPGWFYEPTVIDSLPPDAPLLSEESFGPAAALVTVRDAEEAIAIANDSPYGLSAMLWTADLDRAARLARRFEVGGVFINAVTASDPRVPVGGVKLSGYGRELGRHGLHELCNVQTVWMG